MKKKVLFLVNHDVVIYNFRLELVEKLISEGCEVHISSPYGERIDELVNRGATFHDTSIDRHGMNPLAELKLYSEYKKLLKKIMPDIVLGFTIKPNIWGAFAAHKYKIPFVANITGLGTAVECRSGKQKLLIALYKLAFRDIQKVFFQNTENQLFFFTHKIAIGKHALLPGSGVNLERFPYLDYPDDTVVRFAFISRIMKEKGIEQFLEAAKVLKEQYINTEFHVCGFCEKEYSGELEKLNSDGTVIYHGMIQDVSSFLRDIHCVVHPTYYPEGISNVLLEACASGRPIITTDRAGCKEVVENGINGFMVPQKDSEKLIDALKSFLSLSYEEKIMLGKNARNKVEHSFDRNVVTSAYLKEIEKV